MTKFDLSKKLDDYNVRRQEPSVDRMPKEKRAELEDYVKEYSRFLDKCRTADLVGEWAVNIAERRGFKDIEETDETTKNFYVLNEDHTTFALVKKGRVPLTEGVRFIFTHTDAPALRIKSKPIIFSLDFEDQQVHLGAELDTFSFGGIQNYQWVSRDVDIMGWAVRNGRRRRINFPGVIPDISCHVDNRFYEREELGEAFKEEHLDIVTGYPGFKELLKGLGFRNEEDFARARLWAVPINKPRRLGDFLTGYGHDDRSCTFAAMQALLEIRKPKYTTVVIGFDNEEIDSPGRDAAKGNFFERLLYRMGELEGLEHTELNTHFLYSIYDKSMALSGDVDVGGARREEKWDRIDIKNVAKLGYGAYVSACDGTYAGNQISPAFIDKIVTLFDKNKICRQVVGSPHPADESGQSGSMAEFFTNRGLKTINVGIGAAGLHSPNEIIHVGDLYWMICAYETFFSKS
jgi:aspartyl aminopeptidase